MRRAGRAGTIGLALVAVLASGGCGRSTGPQRSAVTPLPGPPRSTATPLQQWIAHSPMYVAHRGGDADWPEGTAYAYTHAAAWRPDLALEVPVRRTSDGVWVISEDATTGRVFNADVRIRSTPWATLSTLRTRQGDHPMARLANDILDVYGRTRILFVDDKADTNAASFLDVLGSYAGRTRYVVKSYWHARNVATEAHKRGYVTWGYYYAKDMSHFAATQSKFDMLGLDHAAPAADFAAMRATGKPVLVHVVATAHTAQTGLAEGARGLIVSGVQEVVPR